VSDDIVIWHNPRCSKSRQTMQLLTDAGVEPTVIEYLKTPPEPSEIKRVLSILNIAPKALMRTKEAAFKENGLGAADVSDDALVAAMAAHPILIERPVVIKGDRAVIGRPPENVNALLK
jgi:arsenate reductase (glutaredoxin)